MFSKENTKNVSILMCLKFLYNICVH